MKQKVSITQIFTFFLAIIFMFTSCPQPLNQEEKKRLRNNQPMLY